MANHRKLPFKSAALFGVATFALVLSVRVSKNTAQVETLSRTQRRATSQLLSVRVAKIVDGDTIHVLAGGDAGRAAPEAVRLYGIDTPELHTPGAAKPNPVAQRASDYLESLLPPGTDVRLELRGRDAHGRVLAVLILADGRDANCVLLESGWARASFKEGKPDAELQSLYDRAQANAKSAGRGMWR